MNASQQRERALLPACGCAADDPGRAEWALAEAFAAGATGVEELVEGGRDHLRRLRSRGCARDPVRGAVEGTGAQVLDVSPVPAQDWSEAWKRDLAPIVVSPRLVVRPSFASVEARAGQRVLELDPGQAFGTGAHESTRLALEGIDRLADALDARRVLLDVGTGTGVLALAALALGCGRAVALDLDPLAGQAARENAQRNGLGRRTRRLRGRHRGAGSATRASTWSRRTCWPRSCDPCCRPSRPTCVPGVGSCSRGCSTSSWRTCWSARAASA